MTMTTAIITTYVCPTCRFQFIGNAEDVSVWGEAYAGNPLAQGLPHLHCLACYTGKNNGLGQGLVRLEKYTGTDLSLAGTQTVASDEELEAREVEETDEHGELVMEQVGERYELRVNQTTGEIYTEAVPVMAPKMRSLTTQELNDLKTQRDANLDDLERIAI